MKKYSVEITETLQRQLTVYADSREEAEQKVKEKYRNAGILLDEKNHIDTKIELL